MICTRTTFYHCLLTMEKRVVVSWLSADVHPAEMAGSLPTLIRFLRAHKAASSWPSFHQNLPTAYY